jgi:hypothetical protein
VKSAALLRISRRAARGRKLADLGALVWRRIRSRMQAGRDRRMLQSMPDYVLADMGLERIEFRSGADGRRATWLVSHRRT